MNPQILGPAISVLIAWSGILTGVIRWLQGKSEAAFGVAVQLSGQWTYVITKQKFEEITGIKVVD